MVTLVGLARSKCLDLEKIHTVGGQHVLSELDQRSPDPPTTKAREHSHHVDLSGILAVPFERENPHVLMPDRRNDGR